MPECDASKGLAECRGPEDEPIRACSDCREKWPRQLRVVEGET